MWLFSRNSYWFPQDLPQMRSSRPGMFLGRGVLSCNFIEITLRYGCSPVNLVHNFKTPFPKNTPGLWLFICCKTKLKTKYIFFEKIFYKIYIICRKNVFIWKKKVLYWKFSFYWKKLFYWEKYKWKCKKYISYFRNIFLCRKCLCYKSNMNLS